MSTPDFDDYLGRAKDAYDDGSSYATTLSLISIAESLARIADALEAQRVRPVIIQTNGKLTPEQAAAIREAVRDEH